MKSTELIGIKALPFIEWYGDYKESSLEMPWMIDKAHSLYSQPITEDTDFNKLFKGEWDIKEFQDKNRFWVKWIAVDGLQVIRLSDASQGTLNDLITNSPVKLEWNLFEI